MLFVIYRTNTGLESAGDDIYVGLDQTKEAHHGLVYSTIVEVCIGLEINGYLPPEL